MTDHARELDELCRYISERTGAVLSTQQRERVVHAIATRQSAAAEPIADFVRRVKRGEAAAELVELMSVISVHTTEFFRDAAQIEVIREQIIEPLARSGQPISVWSAGCSTGEEVATLLILLAEAGALDRAELVGTDISPKALARARSMVFDADKATHLPRTSFARFFSKEANGFRLSSTLARRARFEQHNLMDRPYPRSRMGPEGRFDLIVCRNVFIYFDTPALEQVVSTLADSLTPSGHLVVAAAESLLPRSDRFVAQQHGIVTIHQRRASAPSPSVPRVEARSGPVRNGPPVSPNEIDDRTLKQFPSTGLGVAGRSSSGSSATPSDAVDPLRDGAYLFSVVLEQSAIDGDSGATERGLRQALYLNPHLAAARYVLGLVLEQRGDRAQALAEYRRAASAIESGSSSETGFFLKNDKLLVACTHAIARVSKMETSSSAPGASAKRSI